MEAEGRSRAGAPLALSSYARHVSPAGTFAPDVFPVQIGSERMGRDWVPVLKLCKWVLEQIEASLVS